jgi:hypothetical protein
MIRKSIFTIYLFISLFGNAQEYTYYLIGRPNSFSYNNALQEVGDLWNIKFSYALGDVYDENVAQQAVDYQKNNDEVTAAICKKSPNCFDGIFEAANFENALQDSIRSVVITREAYLCKSSFLNESYLLLDKRCKGKKQKYLIYLLGNRKSSTLRNIETIAKYSWNLGKLKELKVKNSAIPEGFSTDGLK